MPRELLKRALPKLRRLQFANDSAVERLNALIEDIEAELSKPDQEPLSGLALAAIGVKHFGNPIPHGWYASARELEESHGIGGEK